MNRILLVDDHASFREMLAFVFDREPEFEVVSQVGSLAEACRVLEGVDLAVIDLDLPDGDGTDLIGPLLATNPGARALVLTANPKHEVHARAVQRGAAGVLHKSVCVKGIIDAARNLVAGKPLLSAEEVLDLLRVAGRSWERDSQSRRAVEQLTSREREVLRELADGLNDKEIAERLHISVGTVRNHFVSIFKKFKVHSRQQALVFAARHGIIEIG